VHIDKSLRGIIDNYILDIDYNTNLRFDTNEIVFSNSTTAVLGIARLGYMKLGNG
jgi:hypothetical protein